METYYLIDFENVRNDGIANIESVAKEDHVHIFSTRNVTNIRSDIVWLDEDINFYLVPGNDKSVLKGIHNDLQSAFTNYSEVYEDVKSILEKFLQPKSKETICQGNSRVKRK